KKEEVHMIYNYVDKANYIINVQDKSAMKMPMIGFNKMIEKSAEKGFQKSTKTTWEATSETQTINGFKCKKYICTYQDEKNISKSDVWVTKDATITLNKNYFVGTKIHNYALDNTNNAPAGMPTEGVMIR